MQLTDPRALRALLERHGFRFSKALGQNFLIAPWVPQRIAESAGLDGETGVLEVGPGIGCLTAELARRAGRVAAVELDRRLAPVLAETLEALPNVELVFGDALKLDLPGLVADKLPGLRPVVCANLPYNVTSPLLAAFIDAGCFSRITVMVQREVARRLCAAPGTPEYGAFTFYVNWHCEAQALFDVPPDCFMPRPAVTSSVLQLVPRAAPPAAVADEAFLFRVVRAAFAQRRKTLANALAGGLPDCTKEQAEEALRLLGLDPRVRGETLGAARFAALADTLQKVQKYQKE